MVATADGFAERETAKTMINDAQPTSGRRAAVPAAIAASEGYAISVQKKKLVEQGFGWAKTVGRMRQVMVRGLKRVDQMFVLTMAAYNLTGAHAGKNPSIGRMRGQKCGKTRLRTPKTVLT